MFSRSLLVSFSVPLGILCLMLAPIQLAAGQEQDVSETVPAAEQSPTPTPPASEAAASASAAETAVPAVPAVAAPAAAGDDHSGHDHGQAQPMGVGESAELPDPETVIAEFKRMATPEEFEDGMAAIKAYEAVAAEFQKSVTEMRKEFTRVVNKQSPDRQAYLALRDQSRELMNQTYRKALVVIEYMPHPIAARFVVTILEQRYKHDVYDEETMRGAASLLDYGVRWNYVVLGAGRSAMACGRFDLADNIYENLDYNDMGDEDKALFSMKDVLKQQFEMEQQLLDKDPEVLPQVRMHTTRGVIIADLYINEAPSTVANFIKLVDAGFYDGLDFFQVIDGLLALTGDPLGDGSSKPDQYIADEHGRDVVRMPLAGSLVMAKLPASNEQFVPNSAGTQFAMLFMPLPAIIEEQTVFGRITKGLDVLGALRRVDPHKESKKGEVLEPPDRIIKCEILNRPEILPEVIYATPTIDLP